MISKKKLTPLVLAGIFVLMLGLSYASVPLYEIFCRVTGFGGTTQNASDGWFIGVTHNLVSGAWVGGDDRSIHFRDWVFGQGARTAMPIWQEYMLNIYDNEELQIEKGRFDKPTKQINVEIDLIENLG